MTKKKTRKSPAQRLAQIEALLSDYNALARQMRASDPETYGFLPRSFITKDGDFYTLTDKRTGEFDKVHEYEGWEIVAQLQTRLNAMTALTTDAVTLADLRPGRRRGAAA